MMKSRTTQSKAGGRVSSSLRKPRGKQAYPGHFNARSIEDALSLLRLKKEAKIIAGGVDLVGLMKNRVMIPGALVNLKTIPDLDYIKEEAEGLKIGVLTTLKDIETSAIIKARYSILAQAAHSVASPHVRNMATIAGNLCQEVRCWYYRRPPFVGPTYFCRRKGGDRCFVPDGANHFHAIIGGGPCFAVCASDMAPALVALGAQLRIAGQNGERTIALEEFYTPLGNILKPDEIITEVIVPAPKPGVRQRYLKFRVRKTIDFAISSVAAVIGVEDGVVSDARIVLGGIAPMPYRAMDAEEAIIKKQITDAVAEAAARAALSSVKPLSSNAYKVPITRALVKRAIMAD